MRSPVSSRLVLGREGAVLGGVVGDALVPAVPEHVEPGAGEDADGVGVVTGASVEVCGPRVGVGAVAGEVGDGVAELFVAGPAEGDGAQLAGLSGRGCGAGEAGQGLGGGELDSPVGDLGEQAGGLHAASPGQAAEVVLVGAGVELSADLGRAGFDLLGWDRQRAEQSPGNVRPVGRVVTGDAAWCGDQAGVQLLGVGAPGVAGAGQPAGQPPWVEPVGYCWAVKRVRNARLTRESISANRPTAPEKTLRR